MSLKVIDLEREEIQPFTVTVAQTEVPLDWFDENLQFRTSYVTTQKQRILRCLKKVWNTNFLVFPELCFPQSISWDLKKYALRKKMFIIGGFEYTVDKRNICKVFTPSGKIFEIEKLQPSKYDVGMKTGKCLNVFTNSGFGDFAVVVCYDYTNQKVINKLTGIIDYIFVIARNPDVTTFHAQALSDCYRNFCFIILSNNAEFGGSAIYGPIRSIKRREVNMVFKRIISRKAKILSERLNSMWLKGESLTGINLKSPPADYKRLDLKHEDSFGTPVTHAPPSKYILGHLLYASALRILYGGGWKGKLARLRVLYQLIRTNDVIYSDLFRYSLLRSSDSFKGVVESLMEEGYVERTGIGRQSRYNITENGKKLFDTLMQNWELAVSFARDKYQTELEKISIAGLTAKTVLASFNRIIRYVQTKSREENTTTEVLLRDIEDLFLQQINYK